MKIKNKLTAITLLLGAMCSAPRAGAEPQDNFWLESEWATNLAPSPLHSVGFSTNGQIIIGNDRDSIMVFETNGTLVRSWAAAVCDLDVFTNGLIFAIVELPSVVKVYDTLVANQGTDTNQLLCIVRNIVLGTPIPGFVHAGFLAV